MQCYVKSHAMCLLLMEEELIRAPETLLKPHPVSFLLEGGEKKNPQTFQMMHSYCH